MFIVLKFIFALVGLIFRLSKKKSFFAQMNDEVHTEYKGINFQIQKKHGKNSVVLGTTFLFKFPCSSIFGLARETSFDSFFKKLGISKEIQTNNKEFDETVYITSDSDNFSNLICSNENLQRYVVMFLEDQGKKIFCDKENISFHFHGDVSVNESAKEQFFQIVIELQKIDRQFRETKQDNFEKKVVFTEAVLWSFAGYVIATYVSNNFLADKYGMDDFVDLWQGIKVSIGFFCTLLVILVFWIAAWFKGSSRGHRIIAESFLLLTLTLPFGSYYAVIDLNSLLDTKRCLKFERKVLKKNYVWHSGRHSRGYSYHLDVAPTQSTDPNTVQVSLPESIEIEKSDYEEILEGQIVEIEIGQGFFYVPWYKAVKVKL
jgi:hypothetical protein